MLHPRPGAAGDVVNDDDDDHHHGNVNIIGDFHIHINANLVVVNIGHNNHHAFHGQLPAAVWPPGPGEGQARGALNRPAGYGTATESWWNILDLSKGKFATGI